MILYKLLSLPRTIKQTIAICTDIFSLVLATFGAAYFTNSNVVLDINGILVHIALGCVIFIPLFVHYGMYRAIFRHSGFFAFISISKALVVYGGLYLFATVVIQYKNYHLNESILQPILLSILVFITRALVIYFFYLHCRTNEPKTKNVLIYGAGNYGRQLAIAIRNSSDLNAVGYIDNDKSYHNKSLDGIKVYPESKLPNLVKSESVEEVLIAIDGVDLSKRSRAIDIIQELGVKMRIVPSLQDLHSRDLQLSDLKDIDIGDLLLREPVSPIPELLSKNISSKIVLVTGAAGSIGLELCKQILCNHPKMLILIDMSEIGLYKAQETIVEYVSKNKFQNTNIKYILANVVDRSEIAKIFNEYHPQTIYHAAAYKHVPIVESCAHVGMKNNIHGTLAVVKSAIDIGVECFVLVSTDKAVRPTSVMGASKRICELIVQGYANSLGKTAQTIFSIVRFGNVLGSSGSVVPTFKNQISKGGPVLVTNKDVTRYFMTIPEAAQLVIQAGALGTGGEVFLLDMGSPIKIDDLARRMIILSGATVMDEENPDGKIRIEYIGLRPGEKLFEELLISGQSKKTIHPRILIGSEEAFELTVLNNLLNELDSALADGSTAYLKVQIKKLVPEY